MDIYCDAYAANRREDGGYLVVSKNRTICSEKIPNHTHNPQRAELIAIYMACFHASEGDRILTDSQPMFNAIRNTRCWTAKKEPILVKAIRDNMELKGLSLKWIPRQQNRAGHLIGVKVKFAS